MLPGWSKRPPAHYHRPAADGWSLPLASLPIPTAPLPIVTVLLGDKLPSIVSVPPAEHVRRTAVPAAKRQLAAGVHGHAVAAADHSGDVQWAGAIDDDGAAAADAVGERLCAAAGGKHQARIVHDVVVRGSIAAAPSPSCTSRR